MWKPVRCRPISARLAAIALAFTLGACVPGWRPSEPASAPSAPALVADRLFFGRAIPGGGSVSEEAWAGFLREEVTPRFPDGLTVWRAEGQWTETGGTLVREPVMVVEVLHPVGDRDDSALTRIARAYKERFRQESVLRVTAPARVRFYE